VGSPPVTVKAFAVAPSQAPSNTVTQTFTAATPAKPPTFSSCAADNKSVTLAPTTAGDTVYYTIDGTTPNRKSTAITALTTIAISSPTEKVNALEVGKSTLFSNPMTSKSCPTAP